MTTAKSNKRRARLKGSVQSARSFELRSLPALRRSVRHFTTRQSELRSEVRTLHSEVDRLKAQMGIVGSQTSALISGVGTFEAQIGTLSADIRALGSQVSALNAQVSQQQTEVNALTGPIEETRNILQSRIGTVVTVDTGAGPVSGTLAAIGSDYAEIIEPSGDIVFVLLVNIEFVA